MKWIPAIAAAALLAASCGRSPIAPSRQSVDVLDFVIGDEALWPRMGDQHQHQIVKPGRVCWTKYTLRWMFECWRWDDYTFSDGRWLPRRLEPGTAWSLDLPDNRITWVDAECVAQPERSAPYR